MAQNMTARPVLAEIGAAEAGALRLARQAMLVAVGVALLTAAAKLKLPLPPSPVPISMGTFAVLGIGAAYGPRLGLVTILAYMALGALGADVFANSSATNSGLAYMMGGTGGYLLGYVLATVALGLLARRGWDRSVAWMALAMLIGNVIIYVPGLVWLHGIVAGGAFQPDAFATPLAQTLAWGLWPFLVGDALKLALAALLLPLAWRIVGDARA
ncbi:biotin transporter BioY [Rubellimicrobium sp. CFH 75288]|uniref:biotin transporter BioY n=1 Tax=Rubellimicrobium sp. CFH 75288 TaxID=2697034 RepID=UPI00141203C6|nr:biotin transporter BioY [Rubellimicrobium sp. CFH 75288]NAZ35550.1 biotin transporter BioY [Rubellimicrobium sp. CFH 75288]